MCPQFVDFNADGYDDIITATYAGSPFIVRGSAAGWQQPEVIVNENGEHIRLAIYWDKDKSRWSNADGSQMESYQPEGHCVSAAVFDWDNDGDYDLLIGSYGGKLVLHTNEGKPGAPKFSAEHEPVLVAGEPFFLEGGLTAPRLVDWDSDGLTDIVTGGFKGGVYLYRNTGKVGAPEFSSPVKLIAKSDTPSQGPRSPTSGCYVDPVDYDGDGDLDLLVGGYATWTPEQPQLTDQQKDRVAELGKLVQEKMQAMRKFTEDAREEIEAASTNEERQAIYQRIFEQEEYQALRTEYQQLSNELGTLQPAQQRQAGVWLYRRK